MQHTKKRFFEEKKIASQMFIIQKLEKNGM